MKRGPWLVCVILALGILCFFCVKYHAPMIERDIHDRLEAHLFARDLQHVRLQVSGRDVQLSGSVLNQDQRHQARKLAQTMRGIRRVTESLTISHENQNKAAPVASQNGPVEQAGNQQLLFEYDGQIFQIEGSSPTQESHAAVVNFLKKSLAPNQIREKVEIQSFDVAAWPEAAQSLAQALLSLEKGQALLEKGRWQLSGTTTHAGERTRIQSELYQTMPTQFKGQLNLKLGLSQASIQCQQSFDQILAGESILFETQSTAISSKSQAVLAELAKIASNCPTVQFQIVGHTDSSGAPAQNLLLSEARAAAVKVALTALGVDSNRFTVRGLGSALPIASNKDAAGRAQNRRIEIHVMERSP